MVNDPLLSGFDFPWGNCCMPQVQPKTKTKKKTKERENFGVSALVQRDWCHRCSAGFEFNPWPSGMGHNCSLDLIPGLGIPYTAGQPEKKEKRG